MDHRKEKVVGDPDYRANNKALRIREEKDKEENKLTSEKITNAIVEVFDGEINTRQKQLEEVEEKIFKAQKLLHLVRYVLITSYYKKNDLEVPPEEEVLIPGFDKQNRIHPAVKKLLGSNPKFDIFSAGKGKRRLASRNCDKEGSSSHATETKRPRLGIKSEASNPLPTHSDQNYSRNRKKAKHRIIIGNVSKWVPSLEDNTTHKWMMYVRGDKDKPDISHIVEKVIFHLHPSYKPHDVVEVKESPFHLSRRGWGEFPLRVQIFFKCPLNKPISIVHNLKLERIFTGRQTLGNETLIDVYLYDNISIPKPETITKPPTDSPFGNSWDDASIKEESPNTSYANILNSFDSPVTPNHSDFTPVDEIKSEPVEIDEEFDNSQIRKDFECVYITEGGIKSELIDTSDNLQIKSEELHIKTELVLPVIKSDSAFGDSDHIATSVDLISTRSDSAYGCSDTASMSFEHDYCDVIEEQFVDNEIEVKEDLFLKQFFTEHSYSVLNVTENSDPGFEQTIEHHVAPVNGNVDNKLVFGLGENYLRERIVSVHNVVPKNILVVQKPAAIPRPPLLNGCLDALKAKYIIELPQNRFKNAGEALPYLLKRFKLWDEKAKNQGFRLTYPFVASSEKEFKRWHLGKRLNAEWSRAREIRKILSERFPSSTQWSTRACFMYARSHGFHSAVNSVGNFFKRRSEDLMTMNECFAHSIQLDTEKKNREVDVNVDTETVGSEYTGAQKSAVIDITDVALKNHCAYIKETALDCGVVLRSEEISEGVTMNGAERMIFEAVKCLAEGLIRRANHHSLCREDYRDGHSEVTIGEVDIALRERSELQSIKKFQKKKREIEYFT